MTTPVIVINGSVIVGFDTEKIQRGIGLVAMRERAQLIGGTLAITPRPQGGTIVRLDIPREKVASHDR